MPRWFVAPIRFLLGLDRFATIEQLYEATSSNPLTVLEAPTGGWPQRENHTRLTNHQTSVFYCETQKAGGKHTETIDIHARAHRGGVWVTFVDDDIISLTHNTATRNVQVIHEGERERLWQILLLVRQAVV